MEHGKQPRNTVHLFWGVAGIFILAAYVNIFPPEQFAYVVSFFILLFVTLVFFGLYVFRQFRRSAIIAGGAVLYLFLRYFGLRHGLYAILLVLSVLAVEYLWKSR